MTIPVDYLILGADGQQGLIMSRFFLKHTDRKIVLCDISFDKAREDLKLFSFSKPDSIYFEEVDASEDKNFLELFFKYKPSAVINAGAFLTDPKLVQICVDFNAHWVDLFACPFWFDNLVSFDTDFKIKNITAITGCGSVPGIGNVMARKIVDSMESIQSGHGGFAWDSNIKEFVTPFCLSDVIRELTQPVWVYSEGKFVEIPAQSAKQVMNFPLIGEQTIYAVSHSEVFTYAKLFKDKGLENFVFYAGFPDHCKVVIDALAKLIPFGPGESEEGVFLETEMITSSGWSSVDPNNLAMALGKNGSQFPEGYTESEILWTSFFGTCLSGKKVIRTMHCEVPPIEDWENFGCNVDTAFPAAIIAEMVLEGKLPSGVYSPENSVPPDEFFSRLKALGFSFKTNDADVPTKETAND